MKLAFIRKRFTPFGGAEIYMSRLIRELSRRGFDLEVFSNEWQEMEGVRFHKVDVSGPSFMKSLSFARNAAREVEKAAPGLVISLDRTYCQDVFRLSDGLHREWIKARVKHVSPLKRLSIFLNPMHRAMFRLDKKIFEARRLKFVITNSKRCKGEIISNFGFPGENIFVIYNGIDLAEFDSIDRERARKEIREELNIPDKTVLLLYIGSGFERKGLMYLIRSLQHLPADAGFKLLVIGKGSQKKYRKEAQKLKVDEKVIFKGPVKGAQAYYFAGDVFVLPTLYEPFSNACLEAMAAGMPVVTSIVNGAAELLTDGMDGGILKNPADPVEIAQKISLFLDDEKRRNAGRLARKIAEKQTIKKNVDEFLEVINRAATARKNSTGQF